MGHVKCNFTKHTHEPTIENSENVGRSLSEGKASVLCYW